MNKQLSPNQSWREGANYLSPVQKVLIFGWYDGPTDGVLQCRDGQVHRFDLLAWEPATQDLRVFGLYPMPSAAWEQLIAICGGDRFRWQEQLRQPIEDVIRQAGPVEWVVATEDLQGEIVCVKAIRSDELARVTNWSAFLGLTQELHDIGPYLKFEE